MVGSLTELGTRSATHVARSFLFIHFKERSIKIQWILKYEFIYRLDYFLLLNIFYSTE